MSMDEQWAREHIGTVPAAGGCGTSYHDERGDVQDCTSVEPCRACLRRRIEQLEARPEWTDLSMTKGPSDPTLAVAYHDGYNDCAARSKAFYEARIAQLEARESQRAAERLPKDGDELQALLNKAYRKGNDDAHAAHAVMDGAQLEAQRGGAVMVPDDARSIFFADVRAEKRWQHTKTQLTDEAITPWTVSEAMNYRGFFMHGWTAHAKEFPAIPADRVLRDGEERITAKDLAWFKMREARCLAWDQWAQEEGVELPRADRFESCPKNHVCTPHACEVGNGEWPMCPKGGEVVG